MQDLQVNRFHCIYAYLSNKAAGPWALKDKNMLRQTWKDLTQL